MPQKNQIQLLDQFKRLAIVAMFADDILMERLVLKGGNLLDIIYGVSTRASLDLDFSIEGDFAASVDLSNRVTHALIRTFSDEGYVAFDINVRTVPPLMSDELNEFWGGYKVDFKIVEKQVYEEYKSDIDRLRLKAFSVGKRGSTKFCIDISKHEYCEMKQPHSLDGFLVYVYSPGMCVCEKLRAICQQMPEYAETVFSNPSARARDFVDIKSVASCFSLDFKDPELHSLLAATFATKRVPLALLDRIAEFREYHRSDFESVVATVKPGIALQPFDYYFDFVVSRCDLLKPLWNK